MALPHSKKAKKPTQKTETKESNLAILKKMPGGRFFWVTTVAHGPVNGRAAALRQ